MRCLSSLTIVFAGLLTAAEPLRLHPDNPHYFLFRGEPAVLVTSAEHYGAVLNADFDYRKYLDALASDKLNLTRVFSGLYRELPGSFNITRNTLAPADETKFVTPFKRLAPLRYDLNSWNDAYFERLRDFVSEAGKKGIVVEMTLFTVYYNEKHWDVSPLNAKNNLQNVGHVRFNEVLALKEPGLTAVQEAFVRKVVTELNQFDNLYFEICNEPYVRNEASLEWQRRMTDVIVETESKLPVRHLISWNIANGEAEVRDPHPAVSIFNFHYARPPRTVDMNYALNKVIGMNETGFDGTMDAIYRIQGWDFLLAGGALYNNLDYSFTTGHEDGTFKVPGSDPGWGTPALRKQLGNLRDFMSSVPFTRMHPDSVTLKGGLPENRSARVLAESGKVYAAYLHHGRILSGFQPRYVVETRRQEANLQFELPPGEYTAEWFDPRSGPVRPVAEFSHSGGVRTLTTPEYSEDIAVIIRAR
jgi:hypothetical protein